MPHVAMNRTGPSARAVLGIPVLTIMWRAVSVALSGRDANGSTSDALTSA
jgi:hypothetical protein